MVGRRLRFLLFMSKVGLVNVRGRHLKCFAEHLKGRESATISVGLASLWQTVLEFQFQSFW